MNVRLLFAAGTFTAALVGACGGNVVVDASTTSSGTGAVSGTGGLGTSGVGAGGVGQSATSSGTVTPAGTGGGFTATGTTAVTSSTAVSSSASVSSSSTGGPPGSCTNAADTAALALNQAAIDDDLFTCTLQNVNNEGGIAMCLAAKDGLSLACGLCFGTEGVCGARQCLAECGGGTANPNCLTCLANQCDAAFTACSGIPFPP